MNLLKIGSVTIFGIVLALVLSFSSATTSVSAASEVQVQQVLSASVQPHAPDQIVSNMPMPPMLPGFNVLAKSKYPALCLLTGTYVYAAIPGDDQVLGSLNPNNPNTRFIGITGFGEKPGWVNISQKPVEEPQLIPTSALGPDRSNLNHIMLLTETWVYRSIPAGDPIGSLEPNGKKFTYVGLVSGVRRGWVKISELEMYVPASATGGVGCYSNVWRDSVDITAISTNGANYRVDFADSWATAQHILPNVQVMETARLHMTGVFQMRITAADGVDFVLTGDKTGLGGCTFEEKPSSWCQWDVWIGPDANYHVVLENRGNDGANGGWWVGLK